MAKKVRIRSKSFRSKNAKRWAKGHSSDSNPTITRFREMAASSRFVINEPIENDKRPSKGTAHSLSRKQTISVMKKNETLLDQLRLDDVLQPKLNDAESDDGHSDAQTVETTFSRITNCTNPTFNKVHRLWKSGSSIQEDVLSTLAAVTELIKQNGGQETETEYFSVLITLLAQPDQKALKTLAAATYLLSLAVKKVDYAVLISRFERLIRILFSRLSECVADDTALNKVKDNDANFHDASLIRNAIIRYLIESLGIILKAQPFHVWESRSTVQVFDSLLVFTVDERPKIRKTAHHAVGGILSSNSDKIDLKLASSHPASKLCSKFCAQIFEKYQQHSIPDHQVLQVCQLLSKCLPYFGTADFRSTCENLLSFLASSQDQHERRSFVRSTVFGCFLATLSCAPLDHTMNAETNSKLILAFYDFEPTDNDMDSYLHWCCLLFEAHKCLVSKCQKMSAQILPKFIQRLFDHFVASDVGHSANETANLIKRVLNECIIAPLGTENSFTVELCESVGQNLKNLLSLKCMALWPRSFDILTSFFKSCLKIHMSYWSMLSLDTLLKSMAELRESDQFPCNVQFNKCLGQAIKVLGPEFVLNSIRLNLNCESNLANDFPNSWLLPLLRVNVQQASLSHFVKIFLQPLMQIKNRLSHLELGHSQQYPGEGQILHAIRTQLWELLPSYCKSPSDLCQSFKSIAKFLGSVLVDCPLQRLVVLQSLRTLILNAKTQEEKLELGKFSSNYLPILFNIFLVDLENPQQLSGYDVKGTRQATLETIRIYLSITPELFLKQYLSIALTKMKNLETKSDQKHRILDILIAMAKYLDLDSMRQLFADVRPFCSQSKDKSLQKKSYRVLEEIFNSETDLMKHFLDVERSSVEHMLLVELDKATPSTKASKLRCLTKLFENRSMDVDSFFSQVIPQALVCLKEPNVKTRRSAATFFITICNVMVENLKSVEKASEKIWNNLLMTKFDNETKPLDVACTLIAARLFIFEFKNDVSSQTISFMLSKIVLLIESADRSLVQACLEFFKTFISCLSQVTVGQYLDLLVPSLYRQTEDCQHHFRFLTRKILAKLLRKIPYELLVKYVPAGSFQKQLNNVRKMLQRYERKKRTADGALKATDVANNDEIMSGITGLSRPETIADLLRDTSDEESSPEFDEADTRSKRSLARSKKALPFVLNEKQMDNDDAEILDFLDPKSAVSMITRSNKDQRTFNKKPNNHGFSTDDTGRLIITDEDCTKSMAVQKDHFETSSRKTNVTALFDDDDDDHDIKGPSKKRKKTEFLSSKIARDEDSDIDEALHYKPGGQGIHRNLTFEGKQNKSYGGEFKAKKGRGDVKKKGCVVEPYAYVPLDFKEINKRKQAKSRGKYSGLLHGSKKGAQKGSKSRRKLKRL